LKYPSIEDRLGKKLQIDFGLSVDRHVDLIQALVDRLGETKVSALGSDQGAVLPTMPGGGTP